MNFSLMESFNNSISTVNRKTMTSNEILKADLLDIIFDNRNKQYGAYALRKGYNSRMTIALIASISLFVLVFLIIKPSVSSESIAAFEDPGVTLTEIDMAPIIPEPEPVQPAAVQQQPATAQAEYINRIQIVPNDVVTNITDVSTLETSRIGSYTIDGPPADPATLQPPASSGTGNGIPITKEPEIVKPPLPSSAPEFPGGAQAWLAFLNRHLQSPDELEPGQKKTVLVRFYVGTDGSITNFDVVQSGGREYDNEVIRVLKKMPKWKPAIQNGVPMSVSFTQPVTFIGIEE
jgi:periplasmic protein TonB